MSLGWSCDKPSLSTSTHTSDKTLEEPSRLGKPHNTLFDFERTSEGSQWIEEIATQAREIILSARRPLVLGHLDWSVKIVMSTSLL